MIEISSLYPANYQGKPARLEDVVTPQRLTEFTGQRHDAADTAVFLRQLTSVMSKTYDIQYVDLKARKFIPVETAVNPGAVSYAWEQFDYSGSAKVVDDHATDFPNAGISGKQFETRIVSLGNSYQYSVMDLRSSLMAGLPLEQRKANSAARAMGNLVEALAATGLNPWTNQPLTNASDPLAIYGLANFPGIPGTVGAGGVAGKTTTNWLAAGTTVAQILSDINAMQVQIFNATKGIHTGKNLLLGSAAFAALSTLARSPQFTSDSAIQYILSQSPWLQSIDYWPALDLAGLNQAGNAPGPRAILYDRDPDVLSLVIPQDFEQFAPQWTNMVMKIPCHMRYGGVSVKYPLAITYLDGTGINPTTA